MGTVRVIVFNMDESYGPALRSTLMAFESVRIVAEVDEPAMLSHVAQQFPAEVLLLNLDPTPQMVLPIAGQLVPHHPNLNIFAISESTDGQLILSAMRQGFREFLTKPIDAGVLGDAIQKIALTCEENAGGGKMIACLGTAGGVGTTSLATNLAVELASICDGRVTLVDLDYRFGQVATLLDLSPTYTIADLAHTVEKLEQQVVERALIEHSTGVHVLSRPTHFVQSDNITAANCVGVLSSLLSMNEYVVVDGPNRYDVGASSILDMADTTLMVMQLLVPAVRNAQRIIQGMSEAGFNPERVKLVCNRIGKDMGPLTVGDVEATLNRKVFATVPEDWPTMCSAVNLGEPLALRSPKSKIRMAINDLARRIHDPEKAEAESANSAKKGTLLSKIFSEA
jgi:pilus assembly protein CpaE